MVLGYGRFITVGIDFLIVASVLFLAVRGMASLKRNEETKGDAHAGPALSIEAKLLAEICDSLVSSRETGARG